MFVCYLVILIFNVVGWLNGQTAELWISEPKENIFLTQYPSVKFRRIPSMGSYYVISINESIKYQQMDGFGGSLTDAASYLLQNKLSPAKRQEIMRKIFDSEGINLSLLRQPIGSSDFSLSLFNFDEPTNGDDLNLNKFSMTREEANIRPMLNEALQVNKGRVKLFASPWSPPAWMKTNNSMIGNVGGILRKDCYNAYANYFVNFLKEYEKKGTPVYAITVQNEPQYAPSTYPGMLMSVQEQAAFIRDYLAPKFSQLNITTKIVGFDHNFDIQGVNFANALLSDPKVNPLIAGIGFHTYAAPNHQAMKYFHDIYGKEYWITESGSGLWIGDNTNQFQDQMMHLVRSPSNFAKGVILWNIALDQNASPKLSNVDPDNTNRGFITIRSDTMDSVSYETSYYSVGHSSKFVDPGAYRIDSSSSLDNIETVAYLNPDNTIALVISNRKDDTRDIKINWKDREATFSMKGRSAASLKWKIF